MKKLVLQFDPSSRPTTDHCDFSPETDVTVQDDSPSLAEIIQTYNVTGRVPAPLTLGYQNSSFDETMSEASTDMPPDVEDMNKAYQEQQFLLAKQKQFQVDAERSKTSKNSPTAPAGGTADQSSTDSNSAQVEQVSK